MTDYAERLPDDLTDAHRTHVSEQYSRSREIPPASSFTLTEWWNGMPVPPEYELYVIAPTRGVIEAYGPFPTWKKAAAWAETNYIDCLIAPILKTVVAQGSVVLHFAKPL